MDTNTNAFNTTIPKLESVTDKYRFIPTGEFIRDVEANGYSLVAKYGPRRGLGMHSMVFSHPSLPKLPGFEMRLLATNSHDGSAAFRLHLQAYVLVCKNGLVTWSNTTAARVIHVGYAADKVKIALDTATAHIDKTLAQIKALQSRTVTEEQFAAFLLWAQELRDAKPLFLPALAKVKYSEQAPNTAWNVFNRVQDRLINGGYTTQGQRARRARSITNVREQVRINQTLWKIAIEVFLAPKPPLSIQL